MSNQECKFLKDGNIDKKALFKKLQQIEVKIIELASKYGRGIKLTENEKRKYYQLTEQQMKLYAELKKQGWDKEYFMIGADK